MHCYVVVLFHWHPGEARFQQGACCRTLKPEWEAKLQQLENTARLLYEEDLAVAEQSGDQHRVQGAWGGAIMPGTDSWGPRSIVDNVRARDVLNVLQPLLKTVPEGIGAKLWDVVVNTEARAAWVRTHCARHFEHVMACYSSIHRQEIPGSEADDLCR